MLDASDGKLEFDVLAKITGPLFDLQEKSIDNSLDIDHHTRFSRSCNKRISRE